MTKGTFSYGDERFEYQVFYTPGRQDNIAIHVHPDASVEVDAPEGEETSKIHAAVLKRARWIKTHVERARTQKEHVLPRSYVSGESLFYLGRRYQLKVNSENYQEPGVKLLRGKICVYTQSKDPKIVKKRLAEWYRSRASDVFARRLHEILEQVLWLKSPPPFRLVTMQKQWGSCSPKGAILLNPHLVKAPRECVDYVITHELCHLQEHNHSPRYYRLLGQLMPEWRPVKARLDGMAELLLNE
ncbi:MAG: M48 family metallopeptidase [Candidatus Thiodiazotropha sp. (ex Troendleina suluensis)]|nr:M48 family metallopeptidase [Candidatus Thiodiazotropha sp. (ex Troendleina suluensis)]